MNKKAYMNPMMTIVELTFQPLLAGSPKPHDVVTDQEELVREFWMLDE